MRVTALLLPMALLGTLACGGREEVDPNLQAQQVAPRSMLELERQQTESPLKADRQSHDFGSISMNGGNVETVFRISNSGSSSLRLIAIYTSCGCTSAAIQFTDGSQAGPFGMPGHAGVQTKIDRTVDVGEEFSVRVAFDPAAHGPGGLGRITRVVTIHTADGGTAQLTIAANVVQA